MGYENSTVSPPPAGWDILEFINGLFAQIVGAVVERRDGIDYVNFRLLPYPDLRKAYKIEDSMTDEHGTIWRAYPKDSIVTLNEDDPARKIRFCILDFNGKPTNATKWFKAEEHIATITRLRKDIDSLRMEIAMLKEENLLLKTNIPKYLKSNIGNILGEISPIINQGMSMQSQMVPVKQGV